MQLRDLEADIVECRDDLVRRRQQEELARIAGAILQQGRSRIAAGIHLNGPERHPGRLDVIAQDLLARVDRGLVGIPAIFGIEPVGYQNDVLRINGAGVFRGRVEHRTGRKRHPAQLQPNRLIGVAGGRHIIDERGHRRPVVGQADGGLRTRRILLGYIERRRDAGRRRNDVGVVVACIRHGRVAAIDDATRPCAVAGRSPNRAGAHAGAFGGVQRTAAIALGLVPRRPIEPTGVVVAGAQIDVLDEGDDRYIDVAVVGGSARQLDSMFLAAVCSAGILPDWPSIRYCRARAPRAAKFAPTRRRSTWR